MHHRSIIEQYFFLIIFGILLLIVFLMFRPFLSVLFISGVIAITSRNLHGNILRSVKNPSLAAALSTIIVVVVFLVPLILIASLVFKEATGLYANLVSGNSPFINTIKDFVSERAARFFPGATFDIDTYTRAGLSWLVGHTNVFVTQIFRFGLSLFLVIISLFFFFKDGSHLKQRLISLSPLGDRYDMKLFDSVVMTINTVVKGSLIIALIQGLVAGFGLYLFGVPNPALWGLVTTIAALIPAVGTAIIMVPAIAYLFIIGHTAPAIGLIIWAAFAVGLIDNTLTPFILKRGIHIHPFFILVSVLGGIAFFGPIGFIAGPIVLSLFFELVKLYPTFVTTSHDL